MPYRELTCATAERGNLLTGFSGTKSVKIAVGAYKLEGCDKVTVAAGDDLNDTNLVWIDYPALKLSMIKPPAHIGVRGAFAPIDKMQTI